MTLGPADRHPESTHGVTAAASTVSTGATPPPDVSPPAGRIETLPARAIGVIRRPRATFEVLVAAPRWADVLALTFVVTAASGAALLQTEVGRLALLDQWERTALAFGQPVDAAQYAALEAATRQGALYAVITAFISGPVVALGLTALLYVIFTGVLRGAATFQQLLAVVAHAGVILALRQVIAAPLNYAGETLASPTSLVRMFTMLDEASPLARFLGVVDLFVVWWIIVLEVGVSVLYRRAVRTLALTFVGIYVALALLLAGIMAVAGGTA